RRPAALRADLRRGRVGGRWLAGNRRAPVASAVRRQEMSDRAFDLVVIGSGPAGQKAAIAAAKLRKRVAVTDRRRMLGGVCVNTGTIPSKTLREAILYLSGFRQKTFYGRA